MNALDWRDEFSIGDRVVDDDHRKLIRMLRRRQQDLETRSDPDEIVAILREIVAEIASHFDAEEVEMQQSRYPGLADHKGDHDTLLDELREIMLAVQDDGILDHAQLTDDLDRWFSDHFRTHDARLHGK